MEKATVMSDGQLKEGRPPGDLDGDINLQGERIQKLLERIEALPYPGAKELIQECMEAVLAFYGHGLSRILQIVGRAGLDGRKVYQDLIHDDVIKGLLLIHDLHPLDLEARLREALDKVRPYLRSHGGNVELISLEHDRAKLQLEGTCKSCASSSVTLELAIRQAIEQACPDLVHFEVEGVVQDDKLPLGTRLSAQKSIAWTVIEDAERLAEGAWMPVRIEQIRLVICKVNETFYAYRNRCPACNVPFDAGGLAGGILSCASGHRYDVLHAGRCAEIPSAHLDPFPLLFQEGVIKVALTKDIADAVPQTSSHGT
jgi:Fe-S cluster biogenesis protein NfuA/nitrite reductase/ring-hydroxylating ferredoxin subunit